MDRIRKSDLRKLLQHEPLPRLSLYMPTHRAGSEIQQNPIRFKNLLGDAENSLPGYGLRSSEVQEFLEQARNQLLLDATFWQHQSDGLAVFTAPGLFQYYRLPYEFEETLVVGDQFYVKPIFKVFQNSGRFYILALSQNEVRLLEGSKHGVQSVNLEGVPSSLAEALRWDDPEKQTQSHTVSGGGKGGNGRPDLAFHGHGVGKDDDKTNILRYFQKVDQGLSEYLGDEQVPLVLAGVEYLMPIYHEANSYNYLAEPGITGNPEELSAETLHIRAWELLEPEFKREQHESTELYRQQTGMQTGRASKDIVEIVPAAYAGRVGQLFILEKSQVWGSYDLEHNKVEVHPDRSPKSEDLLNTAALYTFQNNGAVYVVEEAEMPDEAAVAAVFRY